MTQENDRLLPPVQEEEKEMPQLRCAGCQTTRNESRGNTPTPIIDFQCTRNYRGHPSGEGQIVEGIITCDYDGYQTPFKIVGNVLEPTLPYLTDSRLLTDNVLKGLKQDIEEAERCHFIQSYKSSATMCRRALQLGLEERNVTVPGSSKPTLGLLLREAKKISPPLLKTETFLLADGIKDIGDAGAHQRVEIEPRAVATLIYVSVQVLNELFP